MALSSPGLQALQLFQSLSLAEQRQVFSEICQLLWQQNPKEGDWWDELTEEEQQEVFLSLKEASEGKVVSHEQVMAESKTWLNSSSGL